MSINPRFIHSSINVNSVLPQWGKANITQTRTYNGYGEVDKVEDNVFSYEMSCPTVPNHNPIKK